MYDRPMAKAIADLSAFVLAGGKSTRMGEDKAFLDFKGRTLLERALELAGAVASDVRIVGSAEKFAAHADVVEDVFQDCGPLAGIHAALRASSSELNLILAVDMPLVSEDLLRFLIARAESPTITVTVPRTEEGWQPLCAVYRRNFADFAEIALHVRCYKIDALFGSIEVQTIGEQELHKAGFSPVMFRNLNTRNDLELAMRKH